MPEIRPECRAVEYEVAERVVARSRTLYGFSKLRAMTDCRPNCGACCIAPSITTPIPGMPNGKPAGVRCIQLTSDLRCALFGKPERPKVCSALRPATDMCGPRAEHALRYLTALEIATLPSR